jgi:hypothetical protein
VRILLNRNDSIIAFFDFFIPLLALDHTDRTAGQQTAGESWLVH